MEHILKKEYTVKKFWEHVILFIPFKLERISGWSYRDIFKIFISIYKVNHFKTNLENEIFTIGAFVRTLINEILGHFIVSYIFFMFYANIDDNEEIKKHYYSPRVKDKIKKLDKKNYIELIGNILAKIEIEIMNNSNNEIKEIEKDSNLSKNVKNECYEKLERNLFEEFKKIIGNEYAKILSQKLLEKEKKLDLEAKNVGNISINSSESEGSKENHEIDYNLSKKAEEIIEILFQCISEDFENIIKDLDLRQESYKKVESGNVIEILLFNDFSSYMTLKECFFLLNEENYKNTNIFKFRSEFKSIKGKNNHDFLKDLKSGNKIFGKLFSQYYSIYENNKYTKKDFITSKTFRENFSNNLVKRFESFECKNVKIDDSILSSEPDF